MLYCTYQHYVPILVRSHQQAGEQVGHLRAAVAKWSVQFLSGLSTSDQADQGVSTTFAREGLRVRIMSHSWSGYVDPNSNYPGKTYPYVNLSSL